MTYCPLVAILSPMILKQIKKAIEDSGLSQYRIAKDTGIDKSAINRLMKETKGCISLEKADILCDYLGLELKPKQPRKKVKHGKR